MKKIRLYGCTKTMVETYKKLFDQKEVEICSISDKDIEKTVHDIFLISSEYEENGVFEDMFMLFQGFTPDSMSHFIGQLKEMEVPFGGIRILETQHNKDWRLCDLFNEVKQEHDLFQKRAVLKQLILSANQIKVETFPIEIQASYKENLMKSYMVLQNPKSHGDEIGKCIDDTVNLLKGIQ